MSTLVTHVAEGQHPLDAHAAPLFETSTFEFPDVATGAARFRGEAPGYIYTRLGNPNWDQAAAKIAALESIDLLRAGPERRPEEVAVGQVFASGMAAVTSALLARFPAGGTLIAQQAVYSATHNFLADIAPRYGVQVVWLVDPSPEQWEAAFQAHPEASLAYAETPSNPTMGIVDLIALVEIAHRHGAWVMVDNTFASPYCQRPLTLGADVVVHATTKYLSGHGLIIGGAVVSPHLEYMRRDLAAVQRIYGGTPSPFDAWMTCIGLKTFELRMQRHCENAARVAQFLAGHPAVSAVHYPGLESHPGHAAAARQMLHFGGMMSFELKGGMQAGIRLMDRVRVCSLAVSLGSVDTLIEHPASMSHVTVSAEMRHKVGVSDGLVRLSVGIENAEDLIEDLDQGLQ
ncbi:MAG: aminotransferase class I/II-fold pyridoxal phosphate-dependent enzyme [Chloroflexi bacterium]|nr:aminotransferase class I/II-fold pyridoxal phosphate-dependent enzyme [Chloroflexota bacterium]